MKVNSVQLYGDINQKRNLSFGRQIAGEEFSEDVIKEAEKILKSNEKISSDKYEKSFMDCWEDAKVQPIEWLLAPLAIWTGEDNGDPVGAVRASLGVATLGISELLKTPEAGIRKLVSNVKAKKYASQVEKCALAIMRERRMVK